MHKHCTFLAFLLFTLLSFHAMDAQIKEGRFIGASAGLGIVAPDDETDIAGVGFYAQAEYILNLNSWFGMRPYAGFIIASGSSEKEELKQYHVKSNAFLVGAKIRVAAPIPYVAPFLELGVGASLGTFQTYTPLTDVTKKGAQLHVPFSLGFAAGKSHSVDVKFTYYFHPEVEQFSGALAAGIYFPLD